MTAAVLVEIELSGSLSPAVADREELEEWLRGRVDSQLPELGIPGSVEVGVREGQSDRILRVSVNGRDQPYPPDLLLRCWQSIAPAAERGSSWEDADRSLLTELSAEAVLQIVMQHSQALLGDEQFVAYRAGLQSVGADPAKFDETLRAVIRFALRMSVSVAPRDAIAKSVEALLAANLPDHDITEVTLQRVRRDTIEIHCQPAYLTGVAGSGTLHETTSVYDNQFDAHHRLPFERVERALFDELGLRVPDIRWVPDPTIRERTVAIRINDRTGPPLLAPGVSALHVDASVGEVRSKAAEVDVTPFYDAVRGRDLAVIPKGSLEALAETGLAVSTPVEWIATATQFELRTRAADVLGIEDVEYHMAQLDSRHPDVVTAILRRFSLGEITRILRALVRERYSIKDLLTIFERLVLYDEVTVQDVFDLTFDSRFLITRDMHHSPLWVRQFEFVRSSVAPLAIKGNGRAFDALEVIRVEPELEQRAKAVAYQAPDALRSWLDEDEQARLCDRVRDVAEQVKLADEAPVVVTTRWARGGIREVLCAELPDIVVLSHEDFPAASKPSVRATVALDGPRAAP